MSAAGQKSDSAWNRFVRGFRIVSTRVAALAMLAVAMVTEARWPRDGWVDNFLAAFGFLLVLACTMGRIWCSLYIAGYKRKVLVTEGPYALSRNPLYLFSFLGAVGVACATGTLTLTGIMALAFALYYPTVIRNEEAQLGKIFGQAFQDYCARVPAFFPRLSSLLKVQEPEQYTVSPPLIRKSMQSVVWFFIAYLVLHSFERLHELKVLPVLLRLY